MTPKCRKQMSMILWGSRALVASVTSPGGATSDRACVASCCTRDEVWPSFALALWQREIETIILMFENSGATEECRIR